MQFIPVCQTRRPACSVTRKHLFPHFFPAALQAYPPPPVCCQGIDISMKVLVEETQVPRGSKIIVDDAVSLCTGQLWIGADVEVSFTCVLYQKLSQHSPNKCFPYSLSPVQAFTYSYMNNGEHTERLLQRQAWFLFILLILR